MILFRVIGVAIGLLLGAPIAEAQLLDCSGSGCTTAVYGLGDDPVGEFTDPDFLQGSHTQSRTSGGRDPACGPSRFIAHYGQLFISDQNDCVVSNTNRCMVEIPNDGLSGHLNVNKIVIDAGPAGLIGISGAALVNYSGNLGMRQLLGSCTTDADEECSLDSDCPSGSGCVSHCFSEPQTLCASHADCPAADCMTEIDWDAVGRCTDLAGDGVEICSRDGTLPCPAGEECLDGFDVPNNLDVSCSCCHSTSGVLCGAIFGWPEYPTLNCPLVSVPTLRRDASDWIFEGGRGTKFRAQRFTVPGQQEGSCTLNNQRPCGAQGDFWAGSDAGKCENGGADCPDPFDPDNPALLSPCDDVNFGGISGDICDLSEAGWRQTASLLLPDQRPNPSVCGGSTAIRVGTPGESCRLPRDLPEGDPGPGCSVINFGFEARPDGNCNAIDDTVEGRCHPDGLTACSTDADCASGNCVDNGDMCPFLAESTPFADANNDDRGDECQCGDGNGDGAITGLDIAAVALCANGVVNCNSNLVDATGDNATTSEDIAGVVSVVNGAVFTTELLCVLAIDTSTP